MLLLVLEVALNERDEAGVVQEAARDPSVGDANREITAATTAPLGRISSTAPSASVRTRSSRSVRW